MHEPTALLSLALTPATDRDRSKLIDAIRNLRGDDPRLGATVDEATGSIVLAAMGEIHLEIAVDRLKREFGVDASVGRPRVAYAETIAGAAEGEAKYAATVEGRGQYAHVKLRLSPGIPGSGCVLENAVTGGAIPPQFFHAVDEGIRNATTRGMLGGYPVVDVRVVTYDGSYHDVDSTAAAFRIAAAIAFDDAARKATPVLLEPIMRLEVSAPSAQAVGVIDDLKARRGQLQSTHERARSCVIAALVPLAELFGYATSLRACTFGRGAYAIQFESYRPCEPEEPGDFDRGAFVGAPLVPPPSPRAGRIAVPQPLDHDND